MSPRLFQVRELLLSLERSNGVPIGRQLEGQLREAVQGGQLSGGQQLPSTRMLASDLAVSRGVVVRAYAQLAAEGYIELRQGSNPRVRTVPERPRPRLTRSMGEHPRFRYDLRPERPDLDRFPRKAWLRSYRRAMLSATTRDLGYTNRCGLPELRTELASYLGRVRGVAADPECLVVTAGSTHALTLLARVLVREGAKTMGFEDPSHMLFHRLVARSGLRPVGVPVDDEGLVVERLADRQTGVVLVSPAHQFPLGTAMSAERRRLLLRWAEERQGLIVEDDYDAEFRYDRDPVGAVQASAPERVVYIGSTSKTLAPGLRLGWAVLPPELVEPVARELWASTLHLPGIDQLALADFVRSGEFDRHLRQMRGIYRRRRDAMVASLERELPGLPVRGIAAGLHVVLELPSAEEETRARQRASAAGLAVESLLEHALPGYGGPFGLVLGYGPLPEPTIPVAVRALARAIACEEPRRSARNGRSAHANGRRAAALAAGPLSWRAEEPAPDFAVPPEARC